MKLHRISFLLFFASSLTASDTWIVPNNALNNDELDELEIAEAIPSLTEEQKKKSLQA